MFDTVWAENPGGVVVHVAVGDVKESADALIALEVPMLEAPVLKCPVLEPPMIATAVPFDEADGLLKVELIELPLEL